MLRWSQLFLDLCTSPCVTLTDKVFCLPEILSVKRIHILLNDLIVLRPKTDDAHCIFFVSSCSRTFVSLDVVYGILLLLPVLFLCSSVILNCVWSLFESEVVSSTSLVVFHQRVPLQVLLCWRHFIPHITISPFQSFSSIYIWSSSIVKVWLPIILQCYILKFPL